MKYALMVSTMPSVMKDGIMRMHKWLVLHSMNQHFTVSLIGIESCVHTSASHDTPSQLYKLSDIASYCIMLLLVGGAMCKHNQSSLLCPGGTALHGLAPTAVVIAENVRCFGNETHASQCGLTSPPVTRRCYGNSNAAGVRCTQGKYRCYVEGQVR